MATQTKYQVFDVTDEQPREIEGYQEPSSFRKAVNGIRQVAKAERANGRKTVITELPNVYTYEVRDGDNLVRTLKVLPVEVEIPEPEVDPEAEAKRIAKEQAAAEKAAEKERKAAERAAAKEAKDREKAEKAAAKAAAKAATAEATPAPESTESTPEGS